MKRKILYEGKFVRLIDENSWEFVERLNCTGIVIILAMTEDGKVILTEQYRVPVASQVIEFPAGLVSDLEFNSGESLEDAALRELLEETGYQAEKVEHVLTGPVNTGLSTGCLTIYRALNLKKIHAGGGDHTENIIVHEIPFAQAEAWLADIQKKGKLVDPKVYAGLYFLNPDRQHSSQKVEGKRLK